MVKSPLNYPGNKARILEKIIPLFPQDINTFVDVFCGSGIVGLNSKKNKLILNDKNIKIIDLLKFFNETDLEFILKKIEELIEKFSLTNSKIKEYTVYKNEGLSEYNRQGYLKLRESYNKNPSEIKLFLLIIYGFNHYLRFNSKGFFNVPVGKMDFSKSLYEKTIEFIKELKIQNIEFLNLDFRNETLYKNGDFFYFDPPYYITNAPYNIYWSDKDENELYEILDYLNSKNTKFALSNVLLSNGKVNSILKKWAQDYKVIDIKRAYSNANYRRKNITKTNEILVINY